MAPGVTQNEVAVPSLRGPSVAIWTLIYEILVAFNSLPFHTYQTEFPYIWYTWVGSCVGVWKEVGLIPESGV